MCVGARQYTMFVFGFSSLCTLRQYERENDVTLYVYNSITTIYLYYYNTKSYTEIHTYLSVCIYFLNV